MAAIVSPRACVTVRVTSEGYGRYSGIVSNVRKELVLGKGGDADRRGNGVGTL